MSQPEALELPAEAAAVELLPEFAGLAASLRPRNPALQDDIVQEICLAVLLLGRRERELQRSACHRKAYWLRLAEWRAKDFLHVGRHEPVSMDPGDMALLCEALGGAA